MKPTIKRHIAREFLIFILPLLSVIIFFLSTFFYLQSKAKKLDELIDKIANERKALEDDLGLVIKSNMKVYLTMQVKQDSLQSEIFEVMSLNQSLHGDNWSGGTIGKVYIWLLILLYPVRFLIYGIVWSVKILAQKE